MSNAKKGQLRTVRVDGESRIVKRGVDSEDTRFAFSLKTLSELTRAETQRSHRQRTPKQ